MRILGVDPGINGGVAVIDVGSIRPSLVDAIDIPTIGENAKRRVDGPQLQKWIESLGPIAAAYIERAQAMPDQGSSSGFLYGRAVGYIESTVILCRIPVTFIEASVWKRRAGLPGGKSNKEAARQFALQQFPEAVDHLTRKKDHGRAEAILIARHGWLTYHRV